MEEKLYKYIEDHSSTRDDVFEWIRRQTFLRTNHARMLSGEPQGALLTFLVRQCKAQKVIELGTFTGYAAISLALGLQEGGHLDTLEHNDELEDVIREAFRRAAVADKITLHLGDALGSLEELSASGAQYDLAYIDANKREYCAYYEALLPMMRRGGIILADNTLWAGKVLEENAKADAQTAEILRFNDMVCKDRRVEAFILPIRDGLTVITKL